MSQTARSILKFLLFLGVGIGILYFVYQNQEAAFQAECACQGTCQEGYGLMDKIIDDFRSVDVFWLIMIVLAFLLSNVFRALRWNQLIEPLGYQVRAVNTFFATMIGYLVNLALPRAGEIAKPATLSNYEKVPLEKLVGTIFVDRIFDLLMLAVVVGLTLLLQFQYLWDFLFGEKEPSTCVNPALNKVAEEGGFPWMYVFAGAALLGLIAGIYVLANWRTLKHKPLFQKLIQLAQSLFEGMKSVFSLRRPTLFLFYTVMIWVMYYLMMYLCFFAFAPTAQLGPEVALLAFVFGTFGIVIPSPGGMGTYQLAVTAALVIYMVPEAEAFSFANIIFFTINLCNILFGLLGYIVLPIYNRNYAPTPATSTENSIVD